MSIHIHPNTPEQRRSEIERATGMIISPSGELYKATAKAKAVHQWYIRRADRNDDPTPPTAA